MRLHPRIWTVVAFMTIPLLSGCGLSLAGDVTPPPNYIDPTEPPVETPTSAQATNQQAVFPLVPPDPVDGAALYAEKCLPCHGESGMGDGPQAGNLPNPAAPIGSVELARKARPVDWFHIVTTGNLQKFMPGFTESLNDGQRWNVVAYALTLSTPADELKKGKLVYDQNCASCHGADGQRNGAQAASSAMKPTAWNQNQDRLAQLSAEDMIAAFTDGRQDHPAFADKINAGERYALAGYVRSLSFSSLTQPGEAASSGNVPGVNPDTAPTAPATAAATTGTAPQATGEAVSQAEQMITITGQITNGTSGGIIPEGLKVKLEGYQGMQPAFDRTMEVAADGSYRFEGVPFQSDYVYFAQVDANGLVYNSDFLHGTDISGAEASLPLQIFEKTTNPEALRVDRMHIFFDFSQPGLVQVVNLYVISNPTDHVVAAEFKDKPVVAFTVPQGASNLQFQDGQLGDGRYVQTENGFGDTMAVTPGEGQYQVLYAYNMPYDRKLDIPITAPLPVEAATVMLPPVGVKLKSDQLTDAGQRDVQGMSFEMYQSNGSLKQGDTLTVSLTGNASQGSGAAEANDLNPLLVGIGVFVLALAGAGIWLYMQRNTLRPAPVVVAEQVEESIDETGESSETILDAILALDDLHAGGKLPEAAYQERRAELKTRLANVLEREKGR